jgi:hypothetical protein
LAERRRQREVAENLAFQAEACRLLGSTLYAGLLSAAAEDADSGGPSWQVLCEDELEPGPSALALRLMGAVNRLVLAGGEPELAAVYGAPDADPAAAWPVFAATLERRTAELRRLVPLPVQTNEVGRCAALLFGFAEVAARTRLPLRLLEVGASAGLHLCWDRYRYRSAEFAWGEAASPVEVPFALDGGRPTRPPARIDVRIRAGCDLAPLDPGSDEDRRTLLAYVWPDQRERVARLAAAASVAAAEGIEVERAGAAEWVEGQLQRSAPGTATVVFHSIVTQYLPDGELRSFEGALRAAGGAADGDGPLAWLRMEPDGDRAAVRLTTWPGGEERLIARAGYHGTPVGLRPGAAAQ